MTPVAVVTGASSGIGKELVRQLRARGYVVVGLSRRLSEADEHETCDVADRAAVEAVARRVLARHPRIELLVNNAGVAARATFLDGDPEVFENVMRTNYLGGVWCLRAFLPAVEAAAPSDVVNVVSVAGVVAFPPSGPYSASKHAQLAFSRATAAQLRPRGIRVHTVKPGFVETEGFPQKWLPRGARRFVVGPERIAAHIVTSVEKGRAETTVPAYYAVGGVAQALLPNLVTRVLARGGQGSRIAR